MKNEDFVTEISKMDPLQLLGIVITNPEYLTDAHYRIFKSAIHKRYQKFINVKPPCYDVTDDYILGKLYDDRNCPACKHIGTCTTPPF